MENKNRTEARNLIAAAMGGVRIKTCPRCKGSGAALSVKDECCRYCEGSGATTIRVAVNR